jgi:DNA-binding transcriptional LysR family regulator
MKISEIRAFLAVAEAGSMHGAAARLNLTQPAVSRLVQRLEAELGAVLLDRSSKPPTLTPAGQQALAQGRRVLQALDDFSGSVAEGGEPRGSFRLGVSLGLSQLVLNEPLDGLRRKFPGLVLQVSSAWSGDLVKDVESNVMNAAVALSPNHGEPASSAPKKKIGTDRLMVVAPVGSALPPRASLAELAPHGWVLHPEGCSYRSALRRALAQANARRPRQWPGAGAQLPAAAQRLSKPAALHRGAGPRLPPGRLDRPQPLHRVAGAGRRGPGSGHPADAGGLRSCRIRITMISKLNLRNDSPIPRLQDRRLRPPPGFPRSPA